MTGPTEKPVRLDERMAIVAGGLLAITEAGTLLRVSRATIYNLILRGASLPEGEPGSQDPEASSP